MRALPSPAEPPRPHLGRASEILAAVVAAAAVFAVAYDDGGYAVGSRGMWGVAVWWLLALALVAGWWRPEAIGAPAGLVAALLGAYAAVTLASASWAANDARAFAEFNRVTLYLGVFLLLAGAARLLPLARWCDAFALGITGVLLVALLSRFAPSLISDRGLAEGLPSASARLSFPVGYWNGLAIFAGLGVPLLLHAASARRHFVPRAFAVAPLPAVAAVCYLASSRGGFVTAAIGALAYVVLGRHRWSIVGALLAGGLGSAIVLRALASSTQFVNEPAAASRSDRVGVALTLVLGSLAAVALHALSSALLARRRPPRPVNVAAVLVALLLGGAAAAAADPGRRFSEFKEPYSSIGAADDPLRAHLASVNGSGRWQFWESGVEAWRERPWLGHGAGSYEAWWAEQGSLAAFIRDAHSLYVETLAELGVVGFLALLGAGLGGVGAAVLLLRRAESDHAHAAAATTATFVGFAAAAGIDWVWELPALSLVGLGGLALALAPPGRPRRSRRSGGIRWAAAAVAVGVVVAQGIPLLADASIRESQAAAARGEAEAALTAAERARAVQPWSPEPWLQLALVHERAGRLEQARAALRRARAEDARDWRLWLVSARIQTRLGDVASARASLARARSLNPRSPLWERLGRRT